jgi:hypothetical protein
MLLEKLVSCSELLGGLSFEVSVGSTLHNGLDLHSVGGIGDEIWKLLSHLDLSQVELAVEVVPELDLVWLSSQVAQWNVGHTDGSHYFVGDKERLILSEIWSKTLLGENKLCHTQAVLVTNELGKDGGIFSGNFALSNGVLDGDLESVLSEVMPDSLEMWLVRDPLAHLMWVLEVFHSNDLWAELVKSLVLLLEESSSLLSGGVDTEDDLLVLISVCEGVKNLIWVVEMAIVSEPSWVWYLVVEKSAGCTFTELLESEPLDNVWLLSLSPELHWCPLRVKFSHSVIPSLS